MMTPQETLQEVESAMGIVPTFVRGIPPEAVGPFWEKMRDFEMAETAIPAKYKDLIGLAVAASIPCAYCTSFHKEGARLNGANEREMNEAVAMAASVREGSVLVHGTGQSLESFQAELGEIVRHMRGQQPTGNPARATSR